MKKVVKKTKEITEKELKHYLGAIAEQQNETLKTINENFIIVNRKLDSHSKILDSHSKTLDSHSRILSSHTEMIGTMMEDVIIIKSDLKKKVDYDEFTSLVRRVRNLEAKK